MSDWVWRGFSYSRPTRLTISAFLGLQAQPAAQEQADRLGMASFTRINEDARSIPLLEPQGATRTAGPSACVLKANTETWSLR